MVIANGHIAFITKTGGGVIDGVPQPVTHTRGKLIECQKKSNNSSFKGFQNGVSFTKFEWEVLIEDEGHIVTEQVDLFTHSGTLIGRFSVNKFENIERLELIKIYL